MGDSLFTKPLDDLQEFKNEPMNYTAGLYEKKVCLLKLQVEYFSNFRNSSNDVWIW